MESGFSATPYVSKRDQATDMLNSLLKERMDSKWTCLCRSMKINPLIVALCTGKDKHTIPTAAEYLMSVQDQLCQKPFPKSPENVT